MNNIIPRKNLQIICEKQTAGSFVDDAIIMVNLSENTVNNYMIKPMRKEDESYIFKFTEKNLKNDKYDNKYLGRGGLTSVYSIKLKSQKPDNLFKIPEKYKDNLILRIYQKDSSLPITNEINIGDIDTNNDAQTEFIHKWMNDKTVFGENIIDFYMYGEIRVNSNYLCYYTITREYLDYKKIIELPIKNKLKLTLSLIDFLKKIRDNNYIYRDVKFSNIGCDIKDDRIIFIVLDYDNITLFTIDAFDQFRDDYIDNLHYQIGTYPPLYIVGELFNTFRHMPENIIPRFMYNPLLLHLYGLYDIIINLFDKQLQEQPEYRDIFKYEVESFANRLYDLLSRIIKTGQFRINIEKINDRIASPEFRDLLSYLHPVINLDLEPYTKELLLDKLFILVRKMIYPCICIDYRAANKYYKLDEFTTIAQNIIDFINRHEESERRRIAAEAAVASAPVDSNVILMPSFIPSHLGEPEAPTTPTEPVLRTSARLDEELVKKYLKYKQKYLKYKQKYLKYKQKYLSLKKNLI
jgi:serine/threonine protein kinase